MRIALVELTAALGLNLIACGSESDCSQGSVGCSCYGNDTCDPGLTCISEVCVELDESILGNKTSGTQAPSRPSTAKTSSRPANDESGDGSEPASESMNEPADESSMAAAAGAGGPMMQLPRGGTEASEEPPETIGCTPDCGTQECGRDPICQTTCGQCEQGLNCVEGRCRVPVPLRRNGETCGDASECASNNCGRNRAGERLCYGNVQPNEPCSDTFDCSGGICIEKIAGQGNTVCVDGLDACADLNLIGTCTAELAVATCQFNELCGVNTGDFNSCVRFGCMHWYENPPAESAGGCPGQLSFVRGGRSNCRD